MVIMQIFVRLGSDTQVLQVTETQNVLDLKTEVSKLSGATIDDLALYSAGQPLADESVLVNSVAELSTVDAEIRLLGGKVHGSLARAGKVKGQTPKVDPQEGKKRKKTGRARRREQYHRRFVRVVETFGRRRGPNSNS